MITRYMIDFHFEIVNLLQSIRENSMSSTKEEFDEREKCEMLISLYSWGVSKYGWVDSFDWDVALLDGKMSKRSFELFKDKFSNEAISEYKVKFKDVLPGN